MWPKARRFGACTCRAAARPTLRALGLSAVLSTGALACDTALLLTIDVSNSIDIGEYELQTSGMADALLDRDIMEALVQGQSALAVIQWSGVERQVVSIPWTHIRTEADVRALAANARTMPRAFVMSDTAPGMRFYLRWTNSRTRPIVCAKSLIFREMVPPTPGAARRLPRARPSGAG